MVKAQYVRHQPVKAKKEDEYDFSKTQDNVEEFVEDVYNKGPILDGRLIEDVSLNAYVANDIEHKLGRALKGWFLVKQKASLCDVHAYIDSAQSIPTGANTDVEYDTETYDLGSCFDTATGYVTTPHKGYYDVSAAVSLLALGDGKESLIFLYDGTTELARGERVQAGAAGSHTRTLSARVRIDANKAVRVRCYHNSGVNEDTRTGTWNYFIVRAVNELHDDQTNSPDEAKFLRLYSSRDMTASLWVF